MSKPILDLKLKEIRDRVGLRDDFIVYAATCLEIRAKSGDIQRLVLNTIQRKLHDQIERQRLHSGKVRALILKGRQLGCSTYVTGRYYWQASQSRGQRVFILTHSDQATANLFEMVGRFHDHVPFSVRPVTGSASAKELTFAELDSGYKIGTAGTKDVGRSATIQLFHGSEVAFWPNAETHAAGIFQAVPDRPGTEIILESTAQGFGNLFHQMWEDASHARSEYIPIFLPWYWHTEYAKSVPHGTRFSEEDREYQQAYRLSEEQMAWRAQKIQELKSDLLFRQEYPATAAEAFQLTGHDSFIPPALVLKARKTKLSSPPSGPLVIGFDPAWMGGDRHSMAFRKGRAVLNVESRVRLSVTESAGWLGHVIQLDRPKRVFIDVGGVGAGVYDILVEQGFGDIVTAVNFGSVPFTSLGEEAGGPANRRAEMWALSKEWLQDPAGVSIPDKDSLQADACAPSYSYNASSRLLIESKEHIRRRNLASPDEWDAVALTFAEPVMESRFTQPVKRDMSWVV
jgi:hypothetical protein